MLMSDLTARYLDSISDLAPATVAGYRSAINRHILPRWGSTDADAIDLWSVEQWLAGLTYGAARKAWTTLRRILRRGHAWGYVTGDLCNGSPKLPRSQSQPREVPPHRQ